MKKDKIYILSFIVLLIDQFVKFLIAKNMQVLDSISIIPNFFQIHYIQNNGAAWGIMDGKVIILTLIGAGALILLNKYLSREESFNKLSFLAYGLLMGGMIGNLIDRIIHGYVIDYLAFNILGYNFPVFNIADICIVVGIGLIIFDMIRGEINEHKNRKRRN